MKIDHEQLTNLANIAINIAYKSYQETRDIGFFAIALGLCDDCARTLLENLELTGDEGDNFFLEIDPDGTVFGYEEPEDGVVSFDSFTQSTLSV